MEKLLLDAKDIQVLTGWGLSKVRSLLRSGSIPCLKNGRHVRVPRTHLEDWIANEVERTSHQSDQLKEVKRRIAKPEALEVGQGRGRRPTKA